MSYHDQIRKDLAVAEAWSAWDIVDRGLYSAEHGDEFGFFWHRVSGWAESFGPVGQVEQILTNSELVETFVTIIHRGTKHGHLQGLRGGGRDDQAPGTSSGTTVHHASPAGRKRPSRSYA